LILINDIGEIMASNIYNFFREECNLNEIEQIFQSGVEIKKGQWMGLEGDTVYASVDDPLAAAMELFRKLPDIEEKQVITAFYGKGADEEEIMKLEEAFREEFPLIEIGFIEGNQDVYRYIFAIE